MNIYINFNLNVGMQGQPDSSRGKEQDIGLTLSLKQVLEQQSQAVAVCRSASTMSNYLTAIRSLFKYLGRDIPLSSLDTHVIAGYERWLKQRGICLNTVSCYMRSLRSLLCEADKRFGSLFEQVYTGTARTDKRSVSSDTISTLKDLQLPEGSFLELARDVFLFSFYAMGMPFVDVAYLRQNQIADGRIVYNRHKTGQRVQVVVEQPMTDIIRRHSSKAVGDYLFPLLHKGTEQEYRVVLGRYNRALSHLAQMLHCNVRLTSYVVRHTWASTAYGANVDLPVISKALGHANTQTTLTYIREIDDQRVAEANRSIIGMVNDGDHRKTT